MNRGVMTILTKKQKLHVIHFLILLFLLLGIFANLQNQLPSFSANSTDNYFSSSLSDFSSPFSAPIQQITETLMATGSIFKKASPNRVLLLLGANIALNLRRQEDEQNEIPQNRIILKETINLNPGITLREIQRGTALAMGVVQYHIHHLESKDLQIEAIKLGRCKHFFERSIGYSGEEKIWLALERNPKIENILLYIRSNNKICSQKDLVSYTGYSRALISYYIKNLRKYEIIIVNENQLQITEKYKAINLQNHGT